MRKNIYKWHRTISLIIAIPVVLWAASGFMHPIMSTIRPKVATQFLQPDVIDSSKIKLTLQEVLQKNNIVQFHNFRLIHIDTSCFYQVQTTAEAIPVYFSTKTGRKLFNGDRLYAQYLAKQFLEGQPNAAPKKVLYAALSTKVIAENSVEEETAPVETVASHDCCDAATNCVLNNEKGSKVTAVTLVTNFD